MLGFIRRYLPRFIRRKSKAVVKREARATVVAKEEIELKDMVDFYTSYKHKGSKSFIYDMNQNDDNVWIVKVMTMTTRNETTCKRELRALQEIFREQ